MKCMIAYTRWLLWRGLAAHTVHKALECYCAMDGKMQCMHDAGRFNERMVLSLASNSSCLLVDDELNILPTSSHVKNIEPLPMDTDGTSGASAKDTELKGLSESLSDTLVGHIQNPHGTISKTECNAGWHCCRTFAPRKSPKAESFA